MSEALQYKTDFQTPAEVCRYMISLIPEGVKSVLEPTPGIGNISNKLNAFKVTAPEDYFLMPKQRFDCIIMNPPFSSKYAMMENAPDHFKKSGMRLGYQILIDCMAMSNNIIALMPWFTISDSDVRLRLIKRFGLKSITALPRKTFQYARIQTCILELEKDFTGTTKFIVYDCIHDQKQINL